MSIDTYFGLYVATCDICMDESLDGEHDFHDAVAAKKAAGWKSKYDDDTWSDICTKCQELEGV